MDAGIKSKNKEYVKKYRANQKALGRRARLLFLTDEEATELKKVLYEMRTSSHGPGVFGVDYPG